MVYLVGTHIANKKSIYIGLQKIYGIGKKQSQNICSKLGFNKNSFISDLTKKQKQNLLVVLNKLNIIIKSELKRSLQNSKQKLISSRSFRGTRSLQGLPIRGQRTRTNAKTAKKRKKVY
jgi:small subunit ribosomal protein S13